MLLMFCFVFLQHDTVEYRKRLLVKREFAFRTAKGAKQTRAGILSGGWAESVTLILFSALRRPGSLGGPCDADAAGPSLHKPRPPPTLVFTSCLMEKTSGSGSCWEGGSLEFISPLHGLFISQCLRSALTASATSWLCPLTADLLALLFHC